MRELSEAEKVELQKKIEANDPARRIGGGVQLRAETASRNADTSHLTVLSLVALSLSGGAFGLFCQRRWKNPHSGGLEFPT
ncbi:MAG: hypothetical protein ABGY41_22345 [Candidatus Poribacteria bacterium]